VNQKVPTGRWSRHGIKLSLRLTGIQTTHMVHLHLVVFVHTHIRHFGK
jgi:hypothetical protein